MMTTRSGKEEGRSGERNSISAFYAGRSILITGATGFLGKVLVEKLLRSCPDVRELFLLMRPKKGLSIDDRLRRMLELGLFDKLREENPSSFEKLVPVPGDTSVEGLGIPAIERRTITERVSVIFHVAANVRFDENLKKDVFSNTRSTRDICILAASMKNLVALVHVSTAFAHVDKPVIEEILYPPDVDWKSVIRTVENLDEQTLRIFCSKYVGSMPNTYTFSKRLAEQVVTDYSTHLPSVIFRPSIVISTVEEPVPGWLDNFNGPVGMMVGGGKGIMRVALINPLVVADFLPVDVAIKGMITAAWKRGLETVTKQPEVHVYNCSADGIKRFHIKDVLEMGMRNTEKIPLEGTVWYPRTMLTTNRLLHYTLTLFIHLLPALLIDGLLKAAGKEPMLVKIQKTIYSSMVQLRHFLHHEWTFRNTKMLAILTTDLPPAERNIFGYEYQNFDAERFFEQCLIGAKRYLLGEDMNRVKEAKRHYDRMRLIDRMFNGCLIVLLAWIFGKVGFFSYALGLVRSLADGSFFTA